MKVGATKEEVALRAVNGLYNSAHNVCLKISMLTAFRREFHGNNTVQNLCSAYIEKLAEIKYAEMGG